MVQDPEPKPKAYHIHRKDSVRETMHDQNNSTHTERGYT